MTVFFEKALRPAAVALCVAAALGGCAAWRPGKDAVFAPSDALVQQYAKDLARQGQGKIDAQLLAKARQQLVLRDAMAEQARRLGLQRQPAVQAQLQLVEQAVLVRALVQQQLREHPISEPQLRARYAGFVKAYGKQAYLVQEIVAPSASQAARVIGLLKSGSSFATLMNRYAAKGGGWKAGELGWARAGQLLAPFSTLVPTLRVGQYTTDPVRSGSGWHVLRLKAVRPIKAPAFASVRTLLMQQLELEQLQRMESGLLSAPSAKVALQRG